MYIQYPKVSLGDTRGMPNPSYFCSILSLSTSMTKQPELLPTLWLQRADDLSGHTDCTQNDTALVTGAAQTPCAREKRLKSSVHLSSLYDSLLSWQSSPSPGLCGGGQTWTLQPDPLQLPPPFMGDTIQQKPLVQTFASAASEPNGPSEDSSIPYKGTLFTFCTNSLYSWR